MQKSTAPHPAIVLLHGSGGGVESALTHLGPMLEAVGIQLYVPHYFQRTLTTRADLATISDGVHVPQWLETIEDAIRFVASRPSVDPGRIVLAGVSLGAFLALALAAQLSSRPLGATAFDIRALVEISGGLVPPYEAMATSRLPPILVLHGANDTVVPVSFAHALIARLNTLKVPYQVSILPGEGHWFGPAGWPRLLTALSAFLQPLLT